MTRLHSGGQPPKACYVLINGEVERHANILIAATRLGVSGAPGSVIRKRLNSHRVYRPRGGSLCWLVTDQVPEEAREAFEVYRAVVQ